MLFSSNKPLPRTALEPVCKALAIVIQERRKCAGLSLNQLAAQTNLSRPMIRFIEAHERIPTIDTIARISRAFNVPCSKLLAEAESRLKL
jgi:transcriptional regulator with XRE-family HTH domain